MTVFGVIWSILLIAATVFVSFYGGTLSYVLFYTALIVPLVAFVYLLYVFRRFKVSQNLTSHHVVKGAAVPYSYSVANHDIIPYAGVKVAFFDDYSYISGEDGGEECLLPGEKRQRDSELFCLYKGEYKVGIRKVTITDFLSMFRLSYKLPRPLKIKVYPRVIELDSFSLEDDTAGKRENAANTNDIPDALVRDYVNGDPIKRIHWKATARSGKLMTRKYTGEPKEEISIVFDTGLFSKKPAERLEAEDKLIEAVIAVANYFVSKMITVNVFWQEEGDIKAAVISDRREFESFYSAVAELGFNGAVAFPEFLEKILQGVVPVGVTYIFSFPHETLPEKIKAAESLGYTPETVIVKKSTDVITGIGETSLLTINLGEQIEHVIK